MKFITFPILLWIPLIVFSTNIQEIEQKHSCQPIVWMKSDTAIVHPHYIDTISFPKSYTMAMVYASNREQASALLWSIRRTDSISYSVFTDGIKINNKRIPQNRRKNISTPNIFTFQQSIRPDTFYHDITTLEIGEPLYIHDTITSDSIKDEIYLWEYAYFDQRLNRSLLLPFQTYLSLKYGIMLDKSDYVSPRNDTLWKYKEDPIYYHQIQGIGNDSIYRFYSQLSVSQESTPINIFSDSNTMQGSYALIGDNNLPLQWYSYDMLRYRLERTWLLRRTNMLTRMGIVINSSYCQEIDSIPNILLLTKGDDKQQILTCDSIDLCGNYYFYIPQDTCSVYFTILAKMKNPVNPHKSKQKTNNSIQDKSVTFIVSPNPTSGLYSIEINLQETSNINVFVYDASGKLVSKKHLSNQKSYRYDDFLGIQGVYTIGIYNSAGHLITSERLIVN